MFTTTNGKPDKLGVTLSGKGANFCVFAPSAKSVELLFFSDKDAAEPSHTFILSETKNRTAYYWHIFISNVKAAQLYAFRVNGPYRPKQGICFYPQKVLLDPYSFLIARGDNFSREAAIGDVANTDSCLKSVVVDIDDYDWEDDKRPCHRFEKSIIYEMHVKGFTQHESSGVTANKRGTYAGLIEKIPYLKELGITAVELMPVYQFDPDEHSNELANYWGYSPISFFSVHREYSSDQSLLGPINEFRDMVKALHAADIEVILDVVYNHTSEGDETGPIYSFRGYDHSVYYILSEDKKYYMNYSGCGNTLNGTHSVVRRMIIDSLHFWVEKMHVDGFRFDLASILSRDELGKPMISPPTLWSIDTDPTLSSVKLIAEAWDAGGLYQVGSLAGKRWREWNGQFRDDVRRFIKGDQGMLSKFVSRLIGSPDIYGDHDVEPEKSVNFITCHDGFTLYDLVSYNEKHNLANGENNRDGTDANFSWNHGVEGDTDDPQILQFRYQQMKNFLTINIMSLGTPMILMGDEVARTQRGNNNGYCQDNADFWLDWTLLEKNPSLFRFTKALIAQQINRATDGVNGVRRDSLLNIIKKAGIRWHGVKLNQPDWSDSSHAIAFESTNTHSQRITYTIVNAFSEPLNFEIPKTSNRKWLRVVDTSLTDNNDIYVEGDTKTWVKDEYRAAAHSIVILFG
ncbi:glycogen debranching protein GlgX [Psychromonas sp. MME2]|uniref:glycogen debranching protein GlgX n=1 Tax=unclassified Psychromonas TaxID=2614957 RepID=UPI00339BD4AC